MKKKLTLSKKTLDQLVQAKRIVASLADTDDNDEWWAKLMTPKVLQHVTRMTSRLQRETILVWCHTCGCSFDWPWGRCIYRCERCGSGRMSALDPCGQRG